MEMERNEEITNSNSNRNINCSSRWYSTVTTRYFLDMDIYRLTDDGTLSMIDKQVVVLVTFIIMMLIMIIGKSWQFSCQLRCSIFQDIMMRQQNYYILFMAIHRIMIVLNGQS
jgi:hypothetical protein